MVTRKRRDLAGEDPAWSDRHGGGSLCAHRRSDALWRLANYLARFDGKRWERPEPPPEGSGISSYAAGASGDAWAVVDSKRSLWRRSAKGWLPVPLPLADYDVEQVRIDDEGTVWVRASGPVTYDDAGRKTVGFDVALFSTRAPSRVVEFPGPQVVGSP